MMPRFVLLVLAVALATSLVQAQPIPAPREGEAPEFPGTAERGPTPETHPDRSEQNDDEEAEQPAPTSTLVQHEGEPPRGDERRTTAEQREEEDLIAQQAMAEAAVQMLDLTRWQIGLGFVGLIFLLATLIYTARAARAAAAAADAAIESNKISQANLIADQRAWLSIGIKLASPLTWEQNTGRLILVFHIRNTGKTPAHNVITHADITSDLGEVHNLYERMTVVPAEHRSARRGETIFPGLPISISQQTMFRHTSSAPSSPWIYLIGRVVYELSFTGEQHQTKFSFLICRKSLFSSDLTPASFIGPTLGPIPEEDLRLQREGSTPGLIAD